MEIPTQISHTQTNYKQFQYQRLSKAIVIPNSHSLEGTETNAYDKNIPRTLAQMEADAEQVIHLVPDAITGRVNIYLVM